MIVLGIDPGPTHCGAVVYDSAERRVLCAASALTVGEAIAWVRTGSPAPRTLAQQVEEDRIIIEQVMSHGQAGNDLLRTAEVCGRLYEAADNEGLSPVLMPRREVCAALGIAGKGKDAQVREVMIEIHGGSKLAAVGTKRAPGPLYGVSGHAWQALGLVRGWLAREAVAAARAAAGGV